MPRFNVEQNFQKMIIVYLAYISGDILYKKAHMAVAGMIRNYARELVVDFTASYMDYGVSILIPKPQKTTSIFGFLEPLTVQVWICISVATFGIGLMLFILSRLSPYSRHNLLGTDEFNLKNSMWFALASLMQQESVVHLEDNCADKVTFRILQVLKIQKLIFRAFMLQKYLST